VRLALLAIVTIAVTISLQNQDSNAMTGAACNPISVAMQFIAGKYPSFQSTGLKPLISERGNLWQITYQLPEGTIGGVPTVIVDKRTCEVVDFHHTQ